MACPCKPGRINTYLQFIGRVMQQVATFRRGLNHLQIKIRTLRNPGAVKQSRQSQPE